MKTLRQVGIDRVHRIAACGDRDLCYGRGRRAVVRVNFRGRRPRRSRAVRRAQPAGETQPLAERCLPDYLGRVHITMLRESSDPAYSASAEVAAR